MPLTLKITLASISPIEYSSHTWDKITTIVATLGTLPYLKILPAYAISDRLKLHFKIYLPQYLSTNAVFGKTFAEKYDKKGCLIYYPYDG